MSGLRRQRKSLVAAIAFAAGVGVAAETRAQCATVVAQPVVLAYNPLTAGAKTTDFLITATNNTCGAGVTITYGVAKGTVNAVGVVTSLWPGLPVSYAARIFQSGSPGSGIFLNNADLDSAERSVVLSNGDSNSTLYTFFMDERQALPASILDPPFVIFAYGAGQVSNSERMASVTVTSGFLMTVAGVGSTGLLDFGVLEAAEAVQSVNIHTQATGAYRVTLASEQDGVLRNTAIGAGSYAVPYDVTLGGVPINELTSYQVATASGTILLAQGTAILPLIIDLDTSGVAGLRAGIYRDILTLTISAEP